MSHNLTQLLQVYRLVRDDADAVVDATDEQLDDVIDMCLVLITICMMETNERAARSVN